MTGVPPLLVVIITALKNQSEIVLVEARPTHTRGLLPQQIRVGVSRNNRQNSRPYCPMQQVRHWYSLKL